MWSEVTGAERPVGPNSINPNFAGMPACFAIPSIALAAPPAFERRLSRAVALLLRILSFFPLYLLTFNR